MKTVGLLLREARLAKGLTLAEVELATKIRLKFLEAIESDDFRKLPSLAYAKGFVKNYGDFLGLNSDHTLAFFRRQTREAPKSALLPHGMTEPLGSSFFQLTPSRFLALVAAILVLLFLVYFGLQYYRLQTPPRLSIERPKNETVTLDKRVELSGQTDPDATITVNGVSVLVRSDGKFYDQVALEPGVNNITVVATSRYGKTSATELKVGLQQQ